MRLTKDHEELMNNMGIERKHFKLLCEAMRVGLEYTPLHEREKGVLLSVLEGGKSFAETGEQYGILAERTRQIFMKSLRRLKTYIRLYIAEQDELHKEIARLKAENYNLLHSDKIKYSPPFVDNKFSEAQMMVLTTPIEKLNISIRLLNCLKSAEMFTLSDLLVGGYRSTDLLKFRNFGRRSLQELKELFNEIGVEWH